MTKKIIFALLAALYLINTTTFTLSETERGVVMRLGKPLYEVVDAGLNFKYPWPFHSVRKLEKRLVKYDAQPREVITRDKKTMVVDTFGYFKISDGIRYLQATQTLANAQARVDDIVYSEMRNELGQTNFDEILTAKRNAVMEHVTENANKQMLVAGLTTRLIRMNKTDLPQQNKQSVFARMKAEREQQAKTYRSEGDAESTRIHAQTDKEVTVLMAEATRKAQENRGAGDAEAARIFNEAYGRDPEFFRTWRGLEAARKTLTGEGKVKIFLNGSEPHLRVLFGSSK